MEGELILQENQWVLNDKTSFMTFDGFFDENGLNTEGSSTSFTMKGDYVYKQEKQYKGGSFTKSNSIQAPYEPLEGEDGQVSFYIEILPLSGSSVRLLSLSQ